MAGEASDGTGQTREIVAGGIAVATLVVADQVTVLHSLFGLPLFLYLIRDFKRPSSFYDRTIVSMAMSFVTLLFTGYPIDHILAHYSMAKSWDIILAIQWIFVTLLIWVIRAEFELRIARGAT